jgi:hypothetical protein
MFWLEQAIIRPNDGLFTILVRRMVFNSIKHTWTKYATLNELCIAYYIILSVICYSCIPFAHCLLSVKIFHLCSLWILTFLLSHHTLSNFLFYDFMIMSFRKRKMSTFLHCSYYMFFFYFIFFCD